MESVTWSLVLSGLAGGVIALVAGWYLATRISAPVVALTDATQSLVAGDWDTRLPIESEDELGQMSGAFNHMASELQNQEELRRRLVDDVAHELNTPLSVIQLEVEALRDGMQSSDDAAANVVREIDFLQKLVQDLALLTESAPGGWRIPFLSQLTLGC